MAEKQFLHLDRRFRDMSEVELGQPNALESLWPLADSGIGWTDLLMESRLVVLAEAGSGKTDEMRHQAQRLAADGKYAFFFSLEYIIHPLESLLDVQGRADFLRWKCDGFEPAWFFLDSVDELKLADRKLEPTLITFANALGSRREQARVIVSCRPSDWRFVDMKAFQQRLPITPAATKVAPAMDPECFFLSRLKPAPAEPDLFADEAKQGREPEREFRTVVLLPMSDRQVRSFAEQSAIPECEAFLVEIERRDAWDFARRPLDLLELGQVWSERRRLGERQEQHETDVTIKLRDDPERADRDQLEDNKAREGAERLALALMLARKQVFRAGDINLDPALAQATLDPADILSNWTPKQRQVLLRRALFDPATLGRVRFHHRSVQEYLVACRLRTLQAKGLSIRQLLGLFSATLYCQEIVIPSRAPVAAWLALWNAPIRQMLTRLEPETLLSLGDPRSLSHDAKVELLEQFVKSYGIGTWRGVRIPAPELKRLATPEISPTVIRLWGSGPVNPDVRELLLTLIGQGALGGCLDIVSSVVADAQAANHERIIALRAMVACGATEQVSAVVADLITSPSAWPDTIVRNVACELFPRFLSVDGLLQLIERTPEPEGDVNGFRWSAERLVETLETCSPVAVDLRNRLADLIWRKRGSNQSFHDLKSDCDHLTPALKSLCVRQLSLCRLGIDKDLVGACVIANRFSARIHRYRGDRDPLREAFKDHPALRAEAFRQEAARMAEVVPGADAWHRLYYIKHDSLLSQLRDADRPWQIDMLAEEKCATMKEIALQGLLALWDAGGRPPKDVGEILNACAGSPELTRVVAERIGPIEPDPETEQAERQLAEQTKLRAATLEQKHTSWLRWREDLLKDPEAKFGPPYVQHTIHYLYLWFMQKQQGNRDEADRWDEAALGQAFSPEIAALARDAFKRHWRATVPKLWSQRPLSERNNWRYNWFEGYLGIAAEAQEPGWERRLSNEEAKTAIAYATVKLNGLAGFLKELASAHPNQIDEVLGFELTAQLAVGAEHGHLPLMQDLASADHILRTQLTPRLLEGLRAVATDTEGDAAQNWSHHVGHAWRILENTLSEEQVGVVASLCADKARATGDRSLRLSWMKGFFLLDPEGAVKLFEEALHSTKAAERGDEFIELFYDRDWLPAGIGDQTQARVLTRLVRNAFAVIPHTKDEIRAGIQMVGNRERRVMVRDHLFSLLIATPGPEARSGLLQLASDDGFAVFSDRVRLLARARAASDAEPAPLSVSAIRDIDTRFDHLPHDRDSLMTTILDRLADLAHNVAHHDFTDRATLRSITSEEEMQRTLAMRLQQDARGAYLVSREDEVADKKRTDLRLSIPSNNVKAVIEIKMADSWTVAELERALEHQILGQYLRHADCRAGCLLLTYSGRKGQWKPTKESAYVDFAGLVSRLAELAKRLENEQAGKVKLSVFGLDLTDPYLAPAHGG